MYEKGGSEARPVHVLAQGISGLMSLMATTNALQHPLPPAELCWGEAYLSVSRVLLLSASHPAAVWGAGPAWGLCSSVGWCEASQGGDCHQCTGIARRRGAGGGIVNVNLTFTA